GAIVLGDNDGYVFGGRLLDVLGTTDETVAKRVLATAAADDVVRSLRGGLSGVVRPAAGNLSGGQRQRLLLARCLVADPPTLILIEPTSAVDAHTETLVVDRVRAARAGRTTV